MAHSLEGLLHTIEQISRESSELQYNTQQCRFLRTRCSIVGEYARLWQECSGFPSLAVEELVRLLGKASVLIHECTSQKWLYFAALRLTNTRAFASICTALHRLTSSVSSQLIHTTQDLRNKEIQSLLRMPYRHVPLDSLEAAVEALRECSNRDREELVQKARSIQVTHETYALAQHLVQKLSASENELLPVIEPLKLGLMIGAGAFGRVFRSDWHGTSVAVKEFSEGDTSFDKEVKILQELMLDPDPNVLQMIGCYHREDKAYLVMELMEMDLANVIRKHRGSLQLTDSVYIMLQVANGMSYFHERNVVHRDLKPSNILVDRKNLDVKVTDFGVARSEFVSFAPDLSYRRGTLYYMAPEMFRGDKYSREVDVYSFGVTCFQLLTGTLPFQDEKKLPADKLIEMIEAGNRPDLPVDCPREIAVLINRCWNTNPKDRPTFQSISKILESLKEKLLLGQSLVGIQLTSHPEDLTLLAADLISKLSTTAPFVNVLQCSFLQSRCVQLSHYLGVWSDLSLPSLCPALHNLVSTLKSAVCLLEAYGQKRWLQTAAASLHSPNTFRMIVEDMEHFTRVLSFEAANFTVVKSVVPSHSMNHLEQYAEEDKRMIIEKVTEMVSAGTVKEKKLAKYLVKKLGDTAGLPYIEPDEILVQDFLNMSGSGAVFKGEYLGLPVALKNLGSSNEGEKLLKEIHARYSQLKGNMHPNLLSAFGHTKHGEHILLVTEYVSSRLLRVENKPFPPPLAAQVVLQLARGIHHLDQSNLQYIDSNSLLHFEKSDSEGYTGNLTVKISMVMDLVSSNITGITKLKNHLFRTSLRDLKKMNVYEFGSTCLQIICGQETLLSPQVPNNCGSSNKHLVQLVESCLSGKAISFEWIIHALRTELDKEVMDIDYRRMFESMSPESNGYYTSSGLRIMGHAVVGGNLWVSGSMEAGKTRLFQWIRKHRDGTVERLNPFLVTGLEFTVEYSLTAEDFNKAISLTYVDVNDNIEMGGRTETTDSRWVSYSDATKHALKRAWDVGKVKFKVVIMDEKNKKGFMVITRSHYVLTWKMWLRKTKVIMPLSPAVYIKISQEQPNVCHVANRNARSWRVKFEDSASRDLAVLTFRHFMRADMLPMRINSRSLAS